ncbi:MAG: hypothetical protein U1F65_03770 [Verrucomicrobiota bacterium]
MRNTILLTGALAMLLSAGCASEKGFEVTGKLSASEIREYSEAAPQPAAPRRKIEPAVVKPQRRDYLPEPAAAPERPAAKSREVSFPEVPAAAAQIPEPAPAKITVAPDTGLVGKVASVNASLHFVVLNFPVGRMAGIDQQMSLYRQGEKIGEVKITGPQQDDNIIADVVSGEPQPGDEVR